MTTGSAPTAIIGGGIAGLSAAWTLSQAGRACLVLEAQPRWGGAIATENIDGFLLEGGPDSFLAAKPAAVELCCQLNLEEDLIGAEPQPGGPKLLHRGRLLPLPAGWRILAPTRIGPLLRSPLFSPLVKAALAGHWPRTPPPPREDETVAAYLERRFGRTAGRALTCTLAQPLLAGVYGGDASRLSAKEMQPHRTTGPPSSPPAPGGSIFLSLRGGMGSLVEHLIERLQPCLLANCRVRAISQDGAGFRLQLEPGEDLSASAVIVAAPAWRAASLLRDFDGELAAPLSQIPFSSSVNVNFAYRVAPAPLAGHGFLAGGDSPLLACTFAHQKFSGRAPAGGALLRLFYGEALAQATDALIEAHARADLAALLGITQPPDLIRIRTCRRALPQYTVGHGDRLRRVQAALARHPRLALAGNAYGGVGVPDCIASGIAAAAQVLTALG